jgi:hypothetical protein
MFELVKRCSGTAIPEGMLKDQIDRLVARHFKNMRSDEVLNFSVAVTVMRVQVGGGCILLLLESKTLAWAPRASILVELAIRLKLRCSGHKHTNLAAPPSLSVSQRKWRARMRAAKLKRTKETRAERSVVPAYADVVASRDVLLRQAVTSRRVRGQGEGPGPRPFSSTSPDLMVLLWAALQVKGS